MHQRARVCRVPPYTALTGPPTQTPRRSGFSQAHPRLHSLQARTLWSTLPANWHGKTGNKASGYGPAAVTVAHSSGTRRGQRGGHGRTGEWSFITNVSGKGQRGKPPARVEAYSSTSSPYSHPHRIFSYTPPFLPRPPPYVHRVGERIEFLFSIRRVPFTD